MASKKPRQKLVVVTDAHQRIVASALTREDDEIRTGVEPLEGQVVHELEIPEALASLETPEALFAALEDARVTSTGTLQFRTIREEQ